VPIDSLSINSCGSVCSCSTDSQAQGSVVGRPAGKITANQKSPSVRIANHISASARAANPETPTNRSANREAATAKPTNQEAAKPAGQPSGGKESPGGESRRVKVEYLGSIPVESKATDLRSLQVSLIYTLPPSLQCILGLHS
jgi:hypothetical protein